jgi:hypothetical protein
LVPRPEGPWAIVSDRFAVLEAQAPPRAWKSVKNALELELELVLESPV